MRESTPRIITGVHAFQGAGYDTPAPLNGGVTYTVPSDRRAQMIYLRAGNSSAEMVALTLLRDGAPMRVFPIGAKASEHVPLAVVEDLPPETRLDLHVCAPEGASGTVVLDLGLVEI